jgi:hypothetical protein
MTPKYVDKEALPAPQHAEAFHSVSTTAAAYP